MWGMASSPQSPPKASDSKPPTVYMYQKVNARTPRSITGPHWRSMLSRHRDNSQSPLRLPCLVTPAVNRAMAFTRSVASGQAPAAMRLRFTSSTTGRTRPASASPKSDQVSASPSIKRRAVALSPNPPTPSGSSAETASSTSEIARSASGDNLTGLAGRLIAARATASQRFRIPSPVWPFVTTTGTLNLEARRSGSMIRPSRRASSSRLRATTTGSPRSATSTKSCKLRLRLDASTTTTITFGLGFVSPCLATIWSSEKPWSEYVPGVSITVITLPKATERPLLSMTVLPA